MAGSAPTVLPQAEPPGGNKGSNSEESAAGTKRRESEKAVRRRRCLSGESSKMNSALLENKREMRRKPSLHLCLRFFTWNVVVCSEVVSFHTIFLTKYEDSEPISKSYQFSITNIWHRAWHRLSTMIRVGISSWSQL